MLIASLYSEKGRKGMTFMFRKKITLFSIAGFKVQADWSWLILAALIIWTLATGLFPRTVSNISTVLYWVMGVVGAVGIFGSIIFHELCHSLVARQFGMPIEGITLWIFGGVAHMEDNPPSPKAEFLMALAGPASSLFLAGLFLLIHGVTTGSVSGSLFFGRNVQITTGVQGVIWYLGRINLLLGLFNLLPAFPLDGGRILRSGIWRGLNDIVRATRVASIIGSVFGFLLIGGGVFSLFTGSFVGGIWWILIGLFLHNASQNGYRQLLIKKTLSGVPIKKFMKKDPVSVPEEATVAALVEDYVYNYHYKMYPVMEDGRLSGCVTTREIKSVDRENWDTTEVREITQECSGNNSAAPDTDTSHALNLMQKSGNSRLMIVENDELLGIVTLKDLMDYLSLKLDLEQGKIESNVRR
jgi:Zn-dependent protease/CBS domain-containing protein